MTITTSLSALKPLFLVILLAANQSFADTPWNGKAAAVSLTYDDALPSHLDNVLPALDKHGLLGTFYITANSSALRSRMDDWRAMAINGHELGNHTLYHPCAGNKPGREWLSKDRYLDTWPKARYLENLAINNTLLQALDGKSQRSFAYPCGDTEAGGESYIADIAPKFSAARAAWGSPQKIQQIDLMNIPSVMINDHTAEQMKKMVDQAIAGNTWLVFLFHGVGSDYALDVSLAAHNQLLDYLVNKQAAVWVAPIDEIAGFVKAERKQ